MIHKSRICLSALVILALFSTESRAERRSIVVMETSTSGKLLRVSVGARNGIKLGEPVLLSVGDRKVAAGRVVRVEDTHAVVALLETYGSEQPAVDSDYELLFGEPFPEAANLPDYVADRDDEKDNAANERFQLPSDREVAPELDDDNYTPEVSLHPKFPEARTFSPHNITVGLSIFRNRALATEADDSSIESNVQTHTTYNGYSFRYAYTWRSHYWLKMETPALLSAEFSFGMYNFDHTFPESVRPNPNESITHVRVIPLGVELRYLVEVSKLFRLYPYFAYQYNLVGAVNGSLTGLQPLMGGRIAGGVGAQLVMSNTIDARLEGGTDGLLGGLVVKF